MKHRFCAAALAAVLLLSAAPLSPAASAAFSDAEGTWAAEVIEKAEGYGLMNGYPDGTFGVGKELTRGEFVAVLCRMFGWDAASPGAPSFSDCPASHWAYSYVETALAHGVMDAGGAFRPEDYISREEMAVMLVRALGYGTLAQSLSGLELPFDDITDNRGYIAIAYDIGMITGVAGAGGQLKFLPRDSATREEAAAMLVRVYERYTSKLDWLHGFYAFSSYSQIAYPADMDDAYLTGMYGIDLADVEEYRGQYANTNLSTDEILVLKAVEGKADALGDACEARRAAKQEQAAMYDEVQAQKAENGRIVVKGDYVIFVVAGDDGRIADGEVNEVYQEIDGAIEKALA